MKVQPKVYLAGGFKSNWQDKVIDVATDEFIFFNPRIHGLEKSSRQYTTWDLHHVKQCDILFAYMEKDNPSGYGLTLEIGYAKALNKTVILIDEKSDDNNKFSRYFQIVKDSANVIFDNFDEGIEFLRSFKAQNSYAY